MILHGPANFKRHGRVVTYDISLVFLAEGPYTVKGKMLVDGAELKSVCFRSQASEEDDERQLAVSSVCSALG